MNLVITITIIFLLKYTHQFEAQFALLYSKEAMIHVHLISLLLQYVQISFQPLLHRNNKRLLLWLSQRNSDGHLLSDLNEIEFK